MKKFLLSCCFISNILYAQNIGSVAIVVENEPITFYDIKQAMKQLNTDDKQKAIAYLIDDKIQQNEIKKMGIYVSNFELEEKLNQIAKQNKTDLDGLKNKIKNDKLDFEVFKNQLRKDLEREKLYKSIMQNAKITTNEENLKHFYETNLDKFSTFSNVDLIVYNSNNPELLQNLSKNPMQKNSQIKSKAISLNANEIDPRLLALLNNTQTGAFTPVLNGENTFITYFVKAKYGKNPIDFALIKEQVASVYNLTQREQEVKNHLEKIRTNAHIEYLRDN